MTMTDSADDLAQRLARAHADTSLLPADLIPHDADEAYAIQHRTIALRGQTVRGWKVGAKSASGPINGAPLPADRVLASPASVHRRQFARPSPGLELEMAFTFGRVFAPSAKPYSEADVLAGLRSMRATIEVVTSRYADWPAVDKLAQLADLQNHGALAVGDAIDYAPDYPFEAPTLLNWRFNGIDIVKSRPLNPAGDPRRLLTWLVNHATSRGLAIDENIVVTAGTYTGVHFATEPGIAVGEFDGLPPVTLTLV